MITITARCQTCTWSTDPMDRDVLTAADWNATVGAASQHSKKHAGHIVESKAEDTTVARRGSRTRFLMLEIVRE